MFSSVSTTVPATVAEEDSKIPFPPPSLPSSSITFILSVAKYTIGIYSPCPGPRLLPCSLHYWSMSHALDSVFNEKTSSSASSEDLVRPADSELRILIFTACYFVLDGVTLTIRRLESHLRSKGVVIKIVSTVPDDFDKVQSKEIIKVSLSIHT